MQSIQRSVGRIFRSTNCILLDIHRIRIFELTQNENIRKMVDSMVETGVSIDTIQDDGSTLFYVAIRNAEWGVAEYLIDIGADPKVFPLRNRPTNWVFALDELCLDRPFTEQVENRIEWFQRLHDFDVLKMEDKQFTKHLLFVGQYDTKDVIKSVIKRLPESLITREDDLFQKYCAHDWIDRYAMIIKEGRAVTFNQFRLAFRDGSLEFMQMLCQEGIKTFQRFEAFSKVTTQASHFFENLISPFRNDKKIGFIEHFIQENKFKRCTEALFRAAAVHGCSDLVEKYLQIFHVDNVRDCINDDLIDGMFQVCATGGIKEEADPYSSYINTLKLLITAATRKNNEIIEVDKVFKRDDVKLIARKILEDRIFVIERMIFNHVYAYSGRVNILVYNLGVNLACSAVACSDSEMVDLLSKHGLNFRRHSDYCRCRLFPVPRQSPLLCGLEILLGMKKKNIKTNGHMNEVESLEYIGKTVNSFEPQKSCAYSKYCRGECVLSVVIFNTDDIYSREFKSELLKLFLDVCDFDLDMPPKKEISIYDFFVPNEMVESGMFCLFQAGASTEYIKYFSRKFQERTQPQYQSQIYPDYFYNSKLCKAVFSDNNNFLTIGTNRISVQMRSNHSSGLYTSPNFGQLIKEFLDWLRLVTSSPFNLQSQCRTVIRKTLILATGHKSILKRIKLLHLPEELKKFLIYE